MGHCEDVYGVAVDHVDEVIGVARHRCPSHHEVLRQPRDDGAGAWPPLNRFDTDVNRCKEGDAQPRPAILIPARRIP